jgi:hypothetical protein
MTHSRGVRWRTRSSIAPQPCIRWASRTRTMMHACASAANSEVVDPFLTAASKPWPSAGSHHLELRIASLNLVPEAFLCFLRQVTRCRASRGCSLRLGSALAARADAVKVGRRAELDAGSSVDRPHLDGGEHDAMLGPAGGTWLPALRSSMSAALRLTWRRGCCCVTGGTLISAEHERMCQSATPDLQPTLHRTHETICIFAGMHRLQSIEQLPAGQ